MTLAPQLDMKVGTRDGHNLGTVKEIVDDRFKVGVRWSRDYWLLARNILFIDGDRVVMDFDRSEEKSFHVDKPIEV
jgi:hypothetical protein